MRKYLLMLGVLSLAAGHLSCGYLPNSGRGTIVTPTPIYEFAEDYFPLTIGDSWTYDFLYTTDFTDSTLEFEYTVINSADTLVDGFNAVLREAYRADGLWSSSFYTIFGDTILQRSSVGVWKVVRPLNLLPNCDLGDTLWSASSGNNVARWVVLRTDTVLTTPAGTFDPCLYIYYSNQDTVSGEVWYREKRFYSFGLGMVYYFSETNGVNRTEYTLLDYNVQ